MALNVTFDGYSYFGDNSISNSNVSYQAYFYKVNSGSSTSAWNTVRTVESTGYWNVNLGDGDWLGQTGVASSGDIVILDEPTNDVDPLRRRLLWQEVRSLAERDSAVLLVTHNVLEAERAVDRIAIIDQGNVKGMGTSPRARVYRWLVCSFKPHHTNRHRLLA